MLYRSGKVEAAQEVAQRMPVDAMVGPAPAGTTRADVSILLGHDIRRDASCALLDACASKPDRLASAGDLQWRDPGASIGTRR